MEWLTDRITLISDAYRHRRLLITTAIAICAFVGAFDPFTGWIKQKIVQPPTLSSAGGDGMIFGIPSWFVGVILVLFVIVVVIFEYTLSLFRQLQPKFTVDFDEKSDIVMTPTEIHERDAAGNLIVTQSEGSYVRIRLVSGTKTPIHNCHVFLTAIERKRIPTAPFEPIRIYSAVRLTQQAIEVPPSIPVQLAQVR